MGIHHQSPALVVSIGYGLLPMLIVFFFAIVGTYLYGQIRERLPH